MDGQTLLILKKEFLGILLDKLDGMVQGVRPKRENHLAFREHFPPLARLHVGFIEDSIYGPCVLFGAPFAFPSIWPVRTALHEQMPARGFLEMEEVAAKLVLEPSGPELPDPMLTSAYELHADEKQLLGSVLPDGVDLSKVSLTDGEAASRHSEVSGSLPRTPPVFSEFRVLDFLSEFGVRSLGVPRCTSQ